MKLSQYARVSSSMNRPNLVSQSKRCVDFCASNGWVVDEVVEECASGENEFKRHFLGLSDNVTYFAEQLEPANVDVYRYRVIFKPTAIVPDFELNLPE